MIEGSDGREPGDFVTFVGTGAPGTGQYRCTDCGYGITIHGDLPDCPMCGGSSWEETAWSPLSNATAALSSHPAPNL